MANLLPLEEENRLTRPADGQEKNLNYKHKYPILSLKKTYTKPEGDWIVTPKLDGMAMVLYYDDNGRCTMVSRGNYKSGKTYTGLDSLVPVGPKNIIVRGEMVSDKVDATVVTGRCKRSITDDVYFVAFEIVDSEENYSTQLQLLEELGFEVASNTKREYLLDGMVYRKDKWQDYGKTQRFPKHSIAYKWEDKQYLTIVTDITYTTGKTGRITPIVHFKKVNGMQKASVGSKAKLNVKVGDKIAVVKKGMKIPQIHCKANYYVSELNDEMEEYPTWYFETETEFDKKLNTKTTYTKFGGEIDD